MPRWSSFTEFLADIDKNVSSSDRQEMVTALLDEQTFPWIKGNSVTFIYDSDDASNVALNMDIIEGDPPFVAMQQIQGTSLWYVQREFASDDLLDYLITVDDPMTPLRGEEDIVGRISRHWKTDPRNPLTIRTSQMEASVLRMPDARPVPDWRAMPDVPRGSIWEHSFDSRQMNFSGRKLWVYTPPGYEETPDANYPLLILLDGQWMQGPLQIPYITDALIKYGRMEPVIIAMIQSGGQVNRLSEQVSNDKHYHMLLTELVPLLQEQYRIEATVLGIGGVGTGAIAAAHTALKNPAVFKSLIMLSPPLGRGRAQRQLLEYTERFRNAPVLPELIFQSVGRYEIQTRFYKPALAVAGFLQQREIEKRDVDHEIVILGSGHSLIAFKSIMPEALAHVFPGQSHRSHRFSFVS